MKFERRPSKYSKLLLLRDEKGNYCIFYYYTYVELMYASILRILFALRIIEKIKCLLSELANRTRVMNALNASTEVLYLERESVSVRHKRA
jgi:hypothetical protein